MDPLYPKEHFEEEMVPKWWRERSFVLGGVTLFTASFYPPEFKALIRKGLREKKLTWEYLNVSEGSRCEFLFGVLMFWPVTIILVFHEVEFKSDKFVCLRFCI